MLCCMKWKIMYLLIRTYKSICMYNCTLYMPVSNTWVSKKLYVHRNWCWFIIIFMNTIAYVIGLNRFSNLILTQILWRFDFTKHYNLSNNSWNQKCMKIELAIHKIFGSTNKDCIIKYAPKSLFLKLCHEKVVFPTFFLFWHRNSYSYYPIIFFRQAFVKTHCLLFRIWLWGNIWGAKVNSIYWTCNLTNFLVKTFVVPSFV